MHRSDRPGPQAGPELGLRHAHHGRRQLRGEAQDPGRHAARSARPLRTPARHGRRALRLPTRAAPRQRGIAARGDARSGRGGGADLPQLCPTGRRAADARLPAQRRRDRTAAPAAAGGGRWRMVVADRDPGDAPQRAVSRRADLRPEPMGEAAQGRAAPFRAAGERVEAPARRGLAHRPRRALARGAGSARASQPAAPARRRGPHPSLRVPRQRPQAPARGLPRVRDGPARAKTTQARPAGRTQSAVAATTP